MARVRHANSRRKPSFFKVLLDFAKGLRLPLAFVHKYEDHLPKSAKLRITSGEIWDVEIQEEICTDDGKKYLCFNGGGWIKFAEDLGLKNGEFLVFWFNASDSTFDVSNYGIHCCDKQVPAMAVDSACKKEDGRIMSFSVALQNYHRSFIDIPKEFARETGVARMTEIKVQNREGKEWMVELKKCGRIRMAKGWSKFFVENKLACGIICSFGFDANSGNLILKKMEDTNSATKRTRGRSPETLIEVPMKRARGIQVPVKRVRGIEVPVKRARGSTSKARIIRPTTGTEGGTSGIEVPVKRARGTTSKTRIIPPTTGAEGGTSENLVVPPKRGRGRPPKSSICNSVKGVTKRCSDCGLTKTSRWRNGPNGPRTLCNVCGISSVRLSTQRRSKTSATPVRSLHSNTPSEIGKRSYIELEKENEGLRKQNKEMASRLKSVKTHWSNQKDDLKDQVEAVVKDQLRRHYFNGLSQKGQSVS